MGHNVKRRSKPLYWPRFTDSVTALFVELSPADLAAQLVALANEGDQDASNWLTKFISVSAPKKGVVRTLHSDSALEELIDRADDAKITRIPLLTPKRKVVYIEAYDPSPAHDRYATALLRVIEAGLLQRIRYCALKDCGRLFFGDVRARWCSSACGARHRQRMFYREHSK